MSISNAAQKDNILQLYRKKKKKYEIGHPPPHNYNYIQSIPKYEYKEKGKIGK